MKKNVLFMMWLAFAALFTVSTLSACSDDEPETPVIPQLEQKLIGGMWLDGSLEKGNFVTIRFTEGNKAVFNVIIDHKQYFKQLACTYEVNGNTILFTGMNYQPKMIVKSFEDTRMDVEVVNFPAEGQTHNTSFIRKHPTSADNLENTRWTMKTSVSWIDANKDELTLPGNLTINGKRTISLKNMANTFKQMMSDEYWHMVFYDDNTMAQVTCYDDKVQVWSLPYTLDGYKMSCSAAIGDYEGKINYTVFKTEEGNLFFIYKKEAVMAYMIGFYTMQATAQGCEITRNEWEAFANELDASLDRAALFLIFEPDNSGRDYMKETLTYGTWVHQDESLTDKMCFDKNGKMTNTFTNDGESGQVVYDYSVTGNKLTLVNPNGVKMTNRVNLFGDQMVVVFSDHTILYDRK